jgi:hypothetical protein
MLLLLALDLQSGSAQGISRVWVYLNGQWMPFWVSTAVDAPTGPPG